MMICRLTVGDCARTWLLPANGGHGSRSKKAMVLTAKLAFGTFVAAATLWARIQRLLPTKVAMVTWIVAGTYIILSGHSMTILARNAWRQL